MKKKKEIMERQSFVLSNSLVLGALDSQSLGLGSMLKTEVCSRGEVGEKAKYWVQRCLKDVGMGLLAYSSLESR